MIQVYFVRHAQPIHEWEDDRSRPLTAEGAEDAKLVTEFFKDKQIDAFYCSPYKRSMQTILGAADYYQMEIKTDERLCERKEGLNGNNHGMLQKRWGDLMYHEEGGESIQMVQDRNIAALREILLSNEDRKIVIGTHGTALSSILRYYDNSYDCESFLRIIDWMPFIVELDFDGERVVKKVEHLHVYKEFQGKKRADK